MPQVKRLKIEVVYISGHWLVRTMGRERRALAVGMKNKKEAVDMGVVCAKNKAPSSLYIKRRDGTVQEERTYGGKDPNPPKG